MPIASNVKVCIDPSKALEIVREDPIMAFDTETTGLTVRDKICGYVFTNNDYSIYVPVRHEDGGNIPFVDEFEENLRQAFADRERKGHLTIGHHLGFDLRAALRHGIRIAGRLEDTMINESLIYDLTVGYSLDDLANRYKVEVKKGDAIYRAIAHRFGGMPDRKTMANFWRMPGDQGEVVDYAAGDGVSTLQVWECQQEWLDAYDLRRVHALECQLLPYLARIHNRGLRVDMDYATEVVKNIEARVDELMAKFPPGFNARSPKEVEALYRANGFGDGDFVYTSSGAVSFTEKWLETNDIGRSILEIRQMVNAVSKFARPLIDTHNVNGRVHPVLNQSKSDEFGVAGARLSCSDPNMQAYPKRNKTIGKIIRPLVIPDDGFLIEEADFQQQEPRFFTHYSQDPVLLEGYRSGTMDMHDRANDILFGGQDRDRAKRLGMGMLTMMYPKTLANHMRCSVEEARRLHKAFLTEAFPLIHEFQKDAIAVFVQRGYVRTLLGRRAWWDGDPRSDYKAVSRIIQNNGGDHMKTALLRACQYEDAYPDKVQILMSIHDSTLWQRDPGHSPRDLVHAIENVVNEPQFNLSVPIPVEVGSGRNWAEASYGEKIKSKKGWADGVV